MAVNLYNLAPGKGVIIGDSVAIAEPNFKRVDLNHKGQVCLSASMSGQKQKGRNWAVLEYDVVCRAFCLFQVVKFDVIRVESPLVLVINGKKANTEFQAGIQLSTFTKSD